MNRILRLFALCSSLLALSCAHAQVTIPWADVSKTGSSLADLATRSAADLSSGTLDNARLDTDLTSWAGVTRASGFDTFAATPSSANLRSLLTDEVGTGAAYFVGGALGTPSSGTLTNATGLPLTTGVTGTLAITNGGTGQTTASAAFGALKQDATTSATGVVELATTAEALAGTDTARVAPVSAMEQRLLNSGITFANTPHYYSDGSSSNRRIEWTVGNAGAFAGLPATLLFEWDVPSSNPSATAYGPCFTTGTGEPGNQAWSLTIQLTTSGALVVRQNGASVGSDYRILTYAGFRAAYSGQRVRGAIVFSTGDSTTAPVIYIQAVDVTASFTLNTAGTVPTWMTTSLAATKYMASYQWPGGRFVPHSPELGGWTAAEVLEWTQTGRLPTWCEVGTGSAVNVLNSVAAGLTSDAADSTAFNTAYNGYFEVNGTTALASVSSQVLTLSRDGVGAGWSGMFSEGTANSAFPIGSKIRLRFNVTSLSGTWQALANGAATVGTTITTGTNTIEYTKLDNTSIRIYGTGASSSLSIDATSVSFTALPLGPIIKPVINPGSLTLRDNGSNNLTGIVTSGITAITDQVRGSFTGTLTWSGTHESKSLLGAQALPSNAMITQITRKATASSSGSGCTIGTTNSATRWQAADTFTTAKEVATLANQLPAGTAANDLDIVVDPDTANFTGSITVTVHYIVTDGAP